MMAQRVLFGNSRVEEEIEAARIKEMDRVMLMRYGEIRRREKGVPHACDCSAVIHVATSNSPITRGKKYFSCPYEISDGPGQGCGFKRLWNEAFLDEFANIKDENNEMQKRLEEAHKRIDSQEGRIYELKTQYEETVQDRKQLDDYDGELYETGMGVQQLMDKFDALERRYEALEKKYEGLNKYM